MNEEAQPPATAPRVTKSHKKRRKRFKKLRRRLRNFLLGHLGPYILRAWMGSLRYRFTGGGLIGPDPSRRESIVCLVWHQRFLGLLAPYGRGGARILISEHGDGELLSRVAARIGFVPVRGSSTRGGTKAMRQLLRELRSGRDFCVTPDGPRGPAYVMHRGGVYLAALSGLPVVPVTVSYASAWRMPTWDGMLVPRPFTRAVVHMGDPVRLQREKSDDEMEAHRRTLEATLRTLTEETDVRFEELWRQGLTTRELQAHEGIGHRAPS